MSVEGLRIGVVGLPGSWSSETLADAVAACTGTRLLIDAQQIELGPEGRVRQGPHDLTSLDGLILKKIGRSYSAQLLDRLQLLRLVEAQGVPCFSRPSRIMPLLNRIGCTSTLLAGGIPLPPTVITEDPARAAAAIRAMGKAVLKPLYSTKARGMLLLSKKDSKLEQRLAHYQASGNPTFYVQKRVKHRGRDLGVVFMGTEHLGTYARVGAKGSWNTVGGHYERHQPSEQVLALARRARDLFDLEFTSVDIAETTNGPIVFEVSAFGGYRGLLEALDVDAAKRYAGYVVERVLTSREPRLRIVSTAQ